MPKITPEIGGGTMNKKRLEALRKRFGVYKKSQVAKNIRIDAITGKTEQWGVSADENVRTHILRTKFKQMGKKERRWAYFQRTHQGVLVWRTNSRVLRKTYGVNPGKGKHAMASHTPGIKTQVVAGTKGAITEEHGTRDNLRAAAVEKTLADPKRHYLDTAIVGKLGTVQLMMSPQPELNKAKASMTGAGAPTVHSVFPSIGKISKKKGFRRLTSTVHEVREREKIVAAFMLRKAGRKHLIPLGHRLLLKRNKNVDDALKHLRKKSAKANTSFPLNTASYSATDRLDERSLRRMDRRAEKGKRARALSPPRSVGARSSAYPFKK